MATNALRELLPLMPGQDEVVRQKMPIAVAKGGILAAAAETMLAMHVSHTMHDLQSEDEVVRNKAQDRVEKMMPYMAPKKSEVKVTHDHGHLDEDTKDALSAFMKERQALNAEYEID